MFNMIKSNNPNLILHIIVSDKIGLCTIIM